MVLKTFLIILSSLLLLTNCSPREIQITTTPVAISTVRPPNPRPLVLSNINWSVINLNDTIYYGISVSDYELLSLNMQEITRYISEQRNLVTYYQDIIQ